jgi:hypothetical protein
MMMMTTVMDNCSMQQLLVVVMVNAIQMVDQVSLVTEKW